MFTGDTGLACFFLYVLGIGYIRDMVWFSSLVSVDLIFETFVQGVMQQQLSSIKTAAKN